MKCYPKYCRYFIAAFYVIVFYITYRVNNIKPKTQSLGYSPIMVVL